MIWLSWRQQRTETLITAALLAALTALLVPAGVHLASFYDQQGIAHCIGRQTAACNQAIANFGGRAGFVRSLVAGGWLNLAPGLIGVALAAPLVLDLENGTIRLAWTQSVSRNRWLGTKLSVTLVTALAAGAAFSLLFTFYDGPLDRVYGPFDNFGFEGVVPLAYVVFALALTFVVGVLWRRTAPAVIVGFAAYVGARLFVQDWLRQRFAAPLSATWAPHASGPRLDRAWVLAQVPSDKAGHPFTGGAAVLQTCARSFGKGVKGLDPHCLMRHGAGYNHAVWQPASRFWEFQGIETALFGGVALLLLAFASLWLRHRAA
ncbi:MAG TPA: hypothetical protein VE985_10380 [Gaiellaceae bacterium]|nr:hypothetical protein [Gaiellaceae bacterium]